MSRQIDELKNLVTENPSLLTDQHLEQIKLLIDEMERVVRGQATR